MAKDLSNIEYNLIYNGIEQGNDVFLHGFSEIPENYTIEEFSKKLFSEGIKKNKHSSILSTIKLCQHNNPLAEEISAYIAHGRYRIVLKIPEKLEDLYFGKCEKKYNTAGNQDSKNSILDFLNLNYIPAEFIVGIVYTDKMEYSSDEKIDYHFIQNPNYYDDPLNSTKNSAELIKKIKKAIADRDDTIIEHIITGYPPISNTPLKEIKSYREMYDNYNNFIKQRDNYYQSKENDLSI
jgi:hypothetical protein